MEEAKVSVPTKKAISIGKIFKEAWKLTSGLKVTFFWLGFFFLLIISVLAGFGNLKSAAHAGFSTLVTHLVIYIIGELLLWYWVCIVTMLGVRQAIGIPATVEIVQSEIHKVFDRLFFLNMLDFVVWLAFIGIGMLMGRLDTLSLHPMVMTVGKIILGVIDFYIYLILFGIPLFAIPLVIIKKYDALTAFMTALNTTHDYIVSLLLYIALILLLVIPALLTFGILFIWLVPALAVTNGILFREVFGLKRKPSAPPVTK